MANIPHSEQSMRVLAANKEFNQQVLACCCSIITLGPAIAALIIGLQYDENSICNEKTDYLIDLKMYLILAGGVSFGWVVLSVIIICFSQCCCLCRDYNRGKIPYIFSSIFTLPLLIWNFIWAIFGLYMYFEEMSSLCQQEAIGQMLLVWCIIQLLFIGVTLCGLTAIYGEKCCAKMGGE